VKLCRARYGFANSRDGTAVRDRDVKLQGEGKGVKMEEREYEHGKVV